MKRIIAFICTLTLVLSFAMTVNVSAIRGGSEGSTWSGWKVSSGAATISNGVATIKGNSRIDLAYNLQPLQLTVSFNMRVISYCGSMGFQLADGVAGAGFYIGENRLTSLQTNRMLTVPDMTNWHSYVLEIDMEALTQKVYVDDVYIGTHDLKSNITRGLCMFWSSYDSGHFEVENIKIVSNEVEDTSGDLKLTNEYTEPFFFDFNEGGGYVYENKKSVTRHDEEGLIQLSSGPLFGDHGMNTLHTIERPLRPPANYDFEWRMMLTDIHALGGQPAMTALELSTDNRHTWLYINEHKIWHNGKDEQGIDGMALLYDAQDGKWHDWKAEVRGNYITWYVDGNMLMNYQMTTSATGRWHMTVFHQHNSTLSADTWLDWVKYTPYFQKTEIVQPLHQSEFAESKDITFRSVAPEGTEYVDYYIGDTAIGRGYAPDYEFVLSNAKVGTYEVYAKAGDEVSVKNTVRVTKAFDADVKVSSNSIKQGDSITAELVTSEISDGVRAVKADYYMNGKLVASSNQAPFRVTIDDFQVGTSAIYAKVTNIAETVVDTEPIYVSVDSVPGKELKIGREYEIDYNYTSGNGKFELTDGYFKYAMSHSGDKIVYEDLSGTKEYPLGAGEYKALVTAGYAEVYHNGHFAFSYFMPRCSDAPKETYSGLENVRVLGSGVKAELWSKKWEGKADFVADDIPSTYYYSVEFDKTDSSPEEIKFYDGIFENEIFFREDGIYANRQLVIQAPKTEVKLADKVEPGYYRLTVGFGIAQLFRDNEYLGSYRCYKYGHKPQLIRKMTNPSASTITAVKNTDDIFYHDEDFEGNNEFEADEYFQTRVLHYSEGGNVQMKKDLVKKGNNSYMKIDGTGSYDLNGIARDGRFKFRAMFEKEQGQAFFLSRHGRSDTQNRIGYDFDNKRWFVDHIAQNAKVPTNITTNTTLAAPVVGEWHDFEIIHEDRNGKVFMDGVEIFDFEQPENEIGVWYGRFGFGVVGSAISFDDIHYEGENRVTAGLTYNFKNQFPGGAQAAQFYELDEETVIAVGYTYGETKDHGQTWSFVNYTESSFNAASQSVMLPDGSIVKLDEGWVTHSSKSTDGGKTWSEKTPLWGDEFKPTRQPMSSVARLTATMSGSLFMVTSQGDEDYGYSDIWYSHDGGESWNKSETVLTTHNTGIIMNESIVVDTPRENEVWMYGRSDSGFLDYWISYDNGKTFDPTPHHSQLIQSETCFKIVRDWENPMTYYAIFHYDTETSNERGQQMPRNKTALAVSYDGMETWEYITDTFEGNMNPGLQTSDSSISLVGDHLFFRASDYDGPSGDMIGSYDISKIKTLKRHPQLHERYFIGFEPNTDYAINHCVVPKESGLAWVYGDYYNATVQEGRIDLVNAERIFGVTAVKNGNSVELTLGDAKIVFTEGSNSYTLNGETKTAENVCYKGGLVDLKACAALFGKAFREAEGSYSILYQAPAVDQYQGQIDDFA